MNTTTFTIILLIVYMLVLRFIGKIAHHRAKSSSEDFFLVGRDVGLTALIGTTMASVCSTGTVVGGPSEFFTKGTGFFWIYFMAMMPLLILIFGIKFWRLGKAKGFITPADLLADFYKSKFIKLLVGILGLLTLIPYAAAQLVAIGKTFDSLTNGSVPYALGITLAAGAIGLYLYFGGGRAVVWTNTFQGFLFASLVITTAILAVNWAGGWSFMVDNLITKAPQKATFHVNAYYLERVLNCIAFFFMPYIWQRMYMARSARMLAYNFMFLPIIICVLYFATWMIATAGIALFPEGLADGDSVLGAILHQRAPIFGAFVLIAVFSAGMSTVDAQMLSAGSIAVRDIEEVVVGRAKDAAEYKHGRLWTIGLLITVYISSLLLKNLSVMWLLLLGMNITVLFVAPVFGVFYWKKSTTAAAAWSMIIGLVVYILFGVPPIAHLLPVELPATACAFFTSVILFVIISLLTNSRRLDCKRTEYADILR